MSTLKDIKGLWIHLSEMDSQTTLNYSLRNTNNRVYLIVIEGELMIDNEILKERDAIGIYDVSQIEIKSNNSSRMILIEVAMNN